MGMAEFWDARAREDALHFVDNELRYRHADPERLWAGGEEVVATLLERLELELTSTDVAVDLGCGVGRLTRALAARAGHVHAVDVSAEMLARARALNPELGNVTWHRGDGATLRVLGDASADAVVSHVVFQHLPDPQLTYGYVREMGRVLRPGGWAAFQVSDDPAVHRPARAPGRVRVALRRAPRGQRDPAWLGSAVDLEALRAAAADGALEVERVLGEGTQFCLVCARRSG
jgi:SAM-dependent methyltransferase